MVKEIRHLSFCFASLADEVFLPPSAFHRTNDDKNDEACGAGEKAMICFSLMKGVRYVHKTIGYVPKNGQTMKNA